MKNFIRIFHIVFVTVWLISLVFYLLPNNIIYQIISAGILLFFGYLYGYIKKINYQILISTQIYYFLPLVIPLSAGFNINFVIKFIWLCYILSALIFCFSKISHIDQKKNWLVIIVSFLLSATLAKILYFKIPSNNIIIFTTIAFNLIIFCNSWKINFKSPIIFLGILIFYFSFFNFIGNFPYKSQIFSMIYYVGMSYYCFSNKNNSTSYLFALLFLLIISSIKISIFFNPLSASESSIICSITILFLMKSPVIYSKKSRYAKLSVVKYQSHNAHLLFNDGIIHGVEHLDNIKNVSYYSTSSSIGKILSKLTKAENPLKIGVIGLGTGSLSIYGKNKNHQMDFYEIDEEVIKIAKNPELFTFINKSQANINIIKGDARQTLEENIDYDYDVIICDGYFGSFISSKLLTFEALKLYGKKLKREGILLIHVSGIDIEEEFLINNILSLNFKAYTNLQQNSQKNKAINCGLFNFNNKNNIIEDIDNYIKKILIFTGLYIKDLDNFYSNWIIVAKEEKYLNNLLLDKSWIEIKYQDQKQRKLLTDANL